MIKKIDRCGNNLEKSSILKLRQHIPCVYSMSTIWAFGHIENKHTLYCGEDCMKKLCESFREHVKNIIDFEKKNVTINKERTKITPRCKGMLHYVTVCMIHKIFFKR